MKRNQLWVIFGVGCGKNRRKISFRSNPCPPPPPRCRQTSTVQYNADDFYRYQYAQELVTHDPHNNTYDYKHSFSVELVPICKDDLVCLPKKLAHSLGNISRLCLCSRISNLIHLIDPHTGQMAELSSTDYWRNPFEVLCYPKMAVEYTIIDIEPAEISLGSGHGAVSNKVIKFPLT